MSMGALLMAVRDKLRTDMPIPNGRPAKLYVGIQPDGGLPESRDQWYVAIDEYNVASTEKVSLREDYAVEIRVVKDVGRYAADHYEDIYLDHSPGLDDLERKVIRSIHNSHRLRQMANDNAAAPGLTAGDVFQKPLWYRGRGRTTPGDECLIRTLIFGGATRVQAVDVMN